jgi:hypothetical protein
MAKNLALLALLLGVAALFLPLSQTPDGTITKGILMGTMKEPAGLLFVAPQSLAALFGATLGRKRFGRGLGVLHLLLGLAGAGLCGMLFSEPRSGVALGMGTYAALAAGILVVIAGLVGLIKPDPKRI